MQRSLLGWNRMKTRQTCETDIARDSLVAQNM